MKVMVFKTSVDTPGHVKMLKPVLDKTVGKGKWNFALDDCDRILRILSVDISEKRAIQLLQEQGYECAELED